MGIILAKYNHTDDVVFGSVVSGRDAKVAGIEKWLDYSLMQFQRELI